MVLTSSSSSSSCSFSDDVSVKSTSCTIKLLCSYGGKIVPRYPDGKLRYVGGDTRLLAVDRAISFSELQVKLRDLCGWDCAVNIRCPLPAEDLDALISVTSDEDLANLIQEYNLASQDKLVPLKLRLFLLPIISSKGKYSPAASCRRPPLPTAPHQLSVPVQSASRYKKQTGQHHHAYELNHGSRYGKMFLKMAK